jgi:hypothetical protein
MIKKLAVVAAGLALCGAALAADGKRPKSPAMSFLKCPVVMRLALTEEQVTKVKALDTECAAKADEAAKDLKGAEALKKRTEVMEEFRPKLVELLTDDQKKKHEAGMAVVKEFKAKVEEAQAALKAAGKDKDKRAEAQKKVKDVMAEQDKALNEKVGPKAAPVKAGKAGGAPKGEKAGGDPVVNENQF